MEYDPPSKKKGPSGDGLLDLPLAPGAGAPARQGDAPASQPAGEPAPARKGRPAPPERPRPAPGQMGGPSTTPRHQQRGPRDEPGRRRRLWPLALLLLAAAAGAAYWFFLRPPRAEANLAAIEFAPTRTGQEGETASLEIANRGRRALVVAALEISGEGVGDFAVVDDGCIGRSLAAGATCVVGLAFRPTAAGPRVAVLEVSSNAPPPSLGVALQGAGLAPALAAQPERLDFGRVALGKASGTESISLSNGGSAAMTIARMAVEGSGERAFVWVANGCSGKTLEPDESCSVRIAFKPGETGDFKAELRVWSDAPEDPRVVLAGLGVAAGILLEPGAMDFGELRPGQQSDARTIRVSNTGNAPMTIESVVLEGAGRGAFEIARSDCAGRTLEGEATCGVAVRYRPREPARHQAAVRFRSPELQRRAEVVLEGAALEPRILLSESAVEFGQVVQFGTDERRLEIRNGGSAELSLESIDVEGGEGAFGIAERGCPERLVPGAECALRLRFSPGRVGAHDARVRIRHNAPGSPTTVALRGTAGQLPVPKIDVEPAVLAFAALPVGERSDIRSVKVLSSGSARLPLASYEIAAIMPRTSPSCPPRVPVSTPCCRTATARSGCASGPRPPVAGPPE